MTETIRVMHFADTHFGMELYGRLDPATGLNSRLVDFRNSLTRAIDQALEADVELAVFAGDAYKARDPRQTEQREFAHCIRRLTDSGVPVVLLAGNHDLPAIRGRANAVEIYRTLGVTDVHVLSAPDTLVLKTRHGKQVRICAMPYLMKNLSIAKEEFQNKTQDEARILIEGRYDDYLQDLADSARKANDEIPTILLGHFWVNGARLSQWQDSYLFSSEARVSLSSLKNPAFDYVALGHIHRFQDLNPEGQPHVVYCGSPDRIDFGEKEKEKGFVLVELCKGNTSYRFVPVEGSRQLIEIDVDADCDEPTEKILQSIRRHTIKDSIVKLSYKVSEDRAPLVREKEIREALGTAFMTVSINRNVQRSRSDRSELFTESLSSRQALELYIDSRPEWEKRRQTLLEAADELIRETSADGVTG